VHSFIGRAEPLYLTQIDIRCTLLLGQSTRKETFFALSREVRTYENLGLGFKKQNDVIHVLHWNYYLFREQTMCFFAKHSPSLLIQAGKYPLLLYFPFTSSVSPYKLPVAIVRSESEFRGGG
jgi:hypothetical protein